MYIGEVNVVQDKLAGLIKSAECLRIKGLAVPDETPPPPHIGDDNSCLQRNGNNSHYSHQKQHQQQQQKRSSQRHSSRLESNDTSPVAKKRRRDPSSSSEVSDTCLKLNYESRAQEGTPKPNELNKTSESKIKASASVGNKSEPEVRKCNELFYVEVAYFINFFICHLVIIYIKRNLKSLYIYCMVYIFSCWYWPNAIT